MTFTSELIMNDWEKLYFNFQGGQHNSYNSTHTPKEILTVNTIRILMLLCILSSPLYAADSWELSSLDKRRAVPNNITPPARTVPLNVLPSLSGDEGVIRRVKLSDDIKAVALTFDMCELDTTTTGCDMDVINFLRENRIPATLFMGGKWMRTHSERVKQIMTDPVFELANHNWSHGNCALLTDEGLRAQILWTQSEYELLREEAGVSDAPESLTLFRLPYGRNSQRALKTIAELGMRVVQWDVAAEAGDNSKPERAKRSARLVAGMTKPGSILLFHANLVPKGTVNLLREVVNILSNDDYVFVKAGDLLGMGEPETVRAKDNYALDKKFGADGTGRRKPFTGK